MSKVQGKRKLCYQARLSQVCSRKDSPSAPHAQKRSGDLVKTRDFKAFPILAFPLTVNVTSRKLITL